MRLIKPSYEIITSIDGEEILKQIELAARTCYKSEGKIEYDTQIVQYDGMDVTHLIKAKSAHILIPKLIARGHEAMLEFGSNITVKFICDRGVSHELVRHRLASFAQESTRYCNYGKNDHVNCIIPNWLSGIKEGEYMMLEDNGIFDSSNGIIPFNQLSTEELIYLASIYETEVRYKELIRLGWSPQQARSVLPNSLKTEINVSCNVREWRQIFKQRTSPFAHPQMRELMIPLLREFQEKIPLLFDDIKIKENDK